MYYKLLAVCLLFIPSFFTAEAARGRSKSFSGIETRDERPRAPKHHESLESRLAPRKKFPIEVLKAGELYQTTLGPELYGMMVKVKGEKEPTYGSDASKKAEKWWKFLGVVDSMPTFTKDKNTYDALLRIQGEFTSEIDLWICFITDHKFDSVEDFNDMTANTSKILYFFTKHIIIMASSATESSVPIVENLGIFRNMFYKESHDGRRNNSINISHYPHLSMFLSSFSAAVMDHVYPKKYFFMMVPFEYVKQIFLKSFPGADKYFNKVHRRVEQGKGKTINRLGGRWYADFIIYPNPEAAEQEKEGIYTTLGWLRRANLRSCVTVPLTDVADAYFKGVPFKNG
ncbi:MAG: hypothetical protein CMM87_04480 [Rickettsiales bacterium]|nr:hypothetical protein [Rickettsiales bacterium]|tara:strand:- start:19313 stop:20341 length:1029 start_codon:yes stop_codon:yes gene_type:complete